MTAAVAALVIKISIDTGTSNIIFKTNYGGRRRKMILFDCFVLLACEQSTIAPRLVLLLLIERRNSH